MCEVLRQKQVHENTRNWTKMMGRASMSPLLLSVNRLNAVFSMRCSVKDLVRASDKIGDVRDNYE